MRAQLGEIFELDRALWFLAREANVCGAGQTGLKAVDSLVPIGRGAQREGFGSCDWDHLRQIQENPRPKGGYEEQLLRLHLEKLSAQAIVAPPIWDSRHSDLARTAQFKHAGSEKEGCKDDFPDLNRAGFHEEDLGLAAFEIINGVSDGFTMKLEFIEYPFNHGHKSRK